MPDFSKTGKKKGAEFEISTLFFLASWLVTGQKQRLNLACIGEPPASVVWLAERCDASITVHGPTGLTQKGTTNKLRAFEADLKSDHLLLLDSDTIITSDLSPLSALRDKIAARPAGWCRLPEKVWLEIYRGLKIPEPTKRISSLRSRLGLISERQKSRWSGRQAAEMFPYYNGGVLFTPLGIGFRETWREQLKMIAGMFDPGHPQWDAVGNSDMTGLATTIQLFRESGVEFQELPVEYNYPITALHKSSILPPKKTIYHATGFCRGWERSSASSAVSHYQRRSEKRSLREWKNEFGLPDCLLHPLDLLRGQCHVRNWIDYAYRPLVPLVQKALNQG